MLSKNHFYYSISVQVLCDSQHEADWCYQFPSLRLVM